MDAPGRAWQAEHQLLLRPSTGNGTTPVGSPGTSACRSQVVGLLSLPNHVSMKARPETKTWVQAVYGADEPRTDVKE